MIHAAEANIRIGSRTYFQGRAVRGVEGEVSGGACVEGAPERVVSPVVPLGVSARVGAVATCLRGSSGVLRGFSSMSCEAGVIHAASAEMVLDSVCKARMPQEAGGGHHTR